MQLIHPSSFIEPKAIIGDDTHIGAFVHILSGAVIGRECEIHDHVLIENQVIIGDRVIIKSGCQLWNGITIEDNVSIGPNTTFTDEVNRETMIRRGVSIGANATILAGITIGQYAVIEAGSVVHKDVPPYAIVNGYPARVHGYISTGHQSAIERKINYANYHSKVRGVQIYHLPVFTDLRGSLSVGEFNTTLPFLPKRYFISFDVPSREVRGEHAHKTQHQFLVCVSGTCAVVVDDGYQREEILLDQPNMGIHIGPMVWATQYKYAPEAVLLVLASDPYDPDDYIRDYDQFMKAIKLTSNE